MPDSTILVIDDDITTIKLIATALKDEFNVIIATTAADGLNLSASLPDLILLDVMMPKLTGFEVLQALGGKHTTPILMLTAKGDEADKVLGLELGADDYLAKPFQHRELVARIKAILRRIDITKNQQQPTSLQVVNFVSLNHATREVHCHNHLIELTGTEYQVLALLMKSASTIISKAEISEQVLKRKLSPFDRSIDMHVSNIRRKLQPFSPSDKLKTVRGSGYIFLSGEG